MNIKFTLLACIGVVTIALSALAEDNPVHPEADRLLRETSVRLAAAKALSFQAEVWEDVLVAGHKVATTKTVTVKLRRPNGVQIEVRSPSRSRGFWYDRHTLTVLDRVKNLYGTIAVPDTIDQLLDAASDDYGINFPLEDLLVSNPYTNALTGVNGGAYFGKVEVLGMPCQHIAFGTDAVDWQLWISDASSLPRKLVITYKQEPAQPQVTALFDHWDLNARLSDQSFAFKAPKGAAKIAILPAEIPE